MDKKVKSALKKFERDQKQWQEIYRYADEDLYFLSDNTDAQWAAEDYENRRSTGRPALTMDKLGQFTRQVANNIRMNTPTINVIPSDGASNDETAEVYKGLIRNIEYQSRADDAYDTAVLSAIRCSIGFIRVDHDYDNDEGFDQKLIIKRVVNSLSIWLDADSVEADGSDAKHATIITTMTQGDFKKKYPGKAPVSFEVGNGDDIENQSDEDEVQIAEHFYIVDEEKDMALYDDSEEPVEYDEKRSDHKARRKMKKRKVMRCIMSGAEVLEETVFPGKYIPVVPVYGEEMWLRGNRYLFSLIRKAKEAQKLHNYWKSLETELLQKMPNAPIMAAEGQVEEYAEDWKNPQKAAVLRYKTVDAQGNPIPAPQRLAPPMTPQGVFQAGMTTVDDIKSAMGMFNASLGMQSNETSGIAIQRRKQEGEVGQYHFADNLNKAIAQVGRILVCAIPEIYDTERIISIIGEEDDVSPIGINGAIAEGQDNSVLLGEGKYDVRVTTGMSYATMRQESAEFFMQIAQQHPAMMQVMGDLVFKYLDIPGAEALSNRIKKTIPPELIDEEGQEQDPAVMALQQQLQQMQQQMQQYEMIIQEGQKALESKDQETQIKLLAEQNKSQALQAKLELDTAKLQLDYQKQELERLQAEFDARIKTAELEMDEQRLELDVAEGLGRMAIDMQTAENNPQDGLSLGNEANVQYGEYPNDY